MEIFKLFTTAKKKNLIATDSLLNEQIDKLKKRIQVDAVYEGVPINFKIGKDWERYARCIEGKILMREHYSNEFVKCVHNKWSKNSYVPVHYHSDSDQMIWVHNGAISIDIYDKKGINIIETKILTHRNEDQPYKIKKGVPHAIRAISDADFVSRFDISPYPSTLTGFLKNNM